MSIGSPSTEDIWNMYVTSLPADDSDLSRGDATSNKDPDEILDLPPALTDGDDFWTISGLTFLSQVRAFPLRQTRIYHCASAVLVKHVRDA
jgi:hypothetical protein